MQHSKHGITESLTSWTLQNYSVILQECTGVPDTEQDPTLHGIVPVWYVPALKSLHSKHKQELDTDRWIT